jgi:tetratricopeptide (TPR) repeat protein
MTLDEIGICHGTDKSLLRHDYLRHYERLLAPWRDEPITLLEIGVFDGASLLMWEEYFPCATIVGIDVADRCRAYAGGRRVVEIASQADHESMKRIGQQYAPQVVIDDGSHRADHIQIAFDALFPQLRSGGIYIIEDVAMHIGPNADRLRGEAVASPQAAFCALAERVVCPPRGARLAIDSIEFVRSAVAVRKRATDDRLNVARTATQRSGSYRSWGLFAELAIRYGAFDEAVEAARHAISLRPTEGFSHLQLVTALERLGCRDEAIRAATDGLRLAPKNERLRQTAARLSQ